MNVYRTEPEETERPEFVEVRSERLDELERCEDVLRALDTYACEVWFTGDTRRQSWDVSFYTGEVCDVYPVVAEGIGRTLREAVEEAMEWEPVERNSARPPSRVSVVPTLAVLCALFVGLGIWIGAWL